MDETTQDATPVTNGTDQKPCEDNPAELVVDESYKEASEDASYTAENDTDKRKSPVLPLPELTMPDLPSVDVEDSVRGNITDEEGQLTPSGTLSRHGNLDE